MDNLSFAKILYNEHMDQPVKTKHDYLKKVKAGSMIAFKGQDLSINCGKVIQLMDFNTDSFIIESSSGEVSKIESSQIIWVKTGKRWPRQIFDELKKNHLKKG